MDKNPLSHLSTAKPGAMEQRWAAQFAAFDFKVKYQYSKSNGNADALSRQYPSGGEDLEVMLPGTSLPKPLRQELQARKVQATQAAVMVLPQYFPADMSDLQQADPVIRAVVTFWKHNQCPIQEEQKL